MDSFLEDMFQSPVPTLTPLFQIYASMIPALGIAYFLALDISRISISYPLLSTVALVVGIVYQLVLNGLLTFRFQYPEDELNELVSKVTSSIVLRHDVHVWSRKSLTPYAVVFLSPNRRTVLLSTSMVYLMKRMPREAEAVIAKKILCADRHNGLIWFVLSVAIFSLTLMSTFSALLFIPSFTHSFFTRILVLFVILIGLTILFALLRNILWTRGSEVAYIFQEWGIHPRIAEQQLTAGYLYTEEEKENRFWLELENEESQRFRRRYSILLLSILPVMITGLVLFLYLTNLGYHSLGFSVVWVLPGVIFLILYLILRNLDHSALEELWTEKEDAQEPAN